MDAALVLRHAGHSPVGRERIHLLEAVAQHGSITKAAQAVGLSYKAAWDAVNAINNLLPRPAVVAQIGGRRGGGADVTEEGLALIASFHLLEERLARAAAILADQDSPLDLENVLGSLRMKTSARNAFRCTLQEIHAGSVNTEILLRLNEHVTLVAVVTAESVRELDLRLGQTLTALIQASFVILSVGESAPLVSARNRLPGVIVHREDGPVSSDISLDIGDGKTLSVVVTRQSAEDLSLTLGMSCWALFKASHLLLAID